MSLERHEKRVYSQNGEDGVVAYLVSAVGLTGGFFVEIGVEDGRENNTRLLAEGGGWRGAWVDKGRLVHKPASVVFSSTAVTAENVNAILDKMGVPEEFDLLSLDIDGNDYWVWRALRRQPKIVVIEYNGLVPPPASRSIQYDPRFVWSGSRYYGASLCALAKLGAQKGYVLLGCENMGVNAFFVRRDCLGSMQELLPAAAYKPLRVSFREDKRQMVNV